ncbi:MAG: AAA family ATPase, partial [Candidatus Eisenbacteria bacterium]|nr:AAA family ATPase [Candidatus Eisenbacteria bacterium]
MIDRPSHMNQVIAALGRAPIVALLGARQCGKTTLSGMVARGQTATTFDLESPQDLARLQNPELALSATEGLVIIDEIQRKPELFEVLRVIVDRQRTPGRFLILGSASPQLTSGVSESLAGRVEFVDLGGFQLAETGTDALQRLWIRGGFPRSFLAATEEDSCAWRESFIRTFLERDVPQLGISIPAPAMRRFWTMLAHSHGQTWNASELARSMGLDGKTVRGWLDLLTGTFMVRQLQPWFANVGKRQVKSP